MNKIWLIIKREYLVRVRKKSFIIMTFLAPLLMAALLIAPSFIASKSNVLRAIAVKKKILRLLLIIRQRIPTLFNDTRFRS